MNDGQAAIERLLVQGVAAQNAQRFGEAERAYRTALQIDPMHPRALALLGTLAGIAGRFPMAIELFLQALRRDPDNPDLFHNLGETYRQLGDVGKALPAFNRAIELRPDHLEAYRSAADTAIAAARKTADGEHARELRRIAARYLLKLGHKRHAKHLGGAEESFREAASLDPDNNKALSALGSTLARSKPSEAVAALLRAQSLDPKDPSTFNNLGNAYAALQRWDEMEAAFGTAITLDPNFTLARQNLDCTSLMRLLYDEQKGAQDICDRHRAWADEVSRDLGDIAKTPPRFSNSADPNRKLRVAYLSGDFRRHSVAYFLYPLLAQHAPAEVDVYCYAEVENPDAITEMFRACRGTWRDTTKLNDEELRQQLRTDEIDIAIDLAGHTTNNRLRALAVKAAPVTATWLGYPATTGLTTIDWRITDWLADPPGAERYYTEKLMRLDDGFLCYRALDDDVPPVAPPPALAAGFITFGCFNAPQKITPSTVRAWSAILAGVPRSRLLLKGPALADPSLRCHFLDQFAAHGIGAERIELREYAATPQSHLGMYADIDIALDPFPYNGTTTSCEAMWMGVPLITIIGDRHTGRVGFDLLSRVGLAEFAGPDVAGYVAIASALAQDRSRLEQLRRTLRERMQRSSLCDAPRFTRAFERALRAMWQGWCQQGDAI